MEGGRRPGDWGCGSRRPGLSTQRPWTGAPSPWILFLALLAPPVLSAPGLAQEARPAPWSAWGLSGGWIRQGISDELISPLHYLGNGWHVALARESWSPGSTWDVRASYFAPSLGSDAPLQDGGFQETSQGNLAVHYLRRVGSLLDDRVLIRAGGALAARVAIRKHQFNALSDETYADAFAPLSVAGSWEMAVPGGYLRHRLTLPVLTLVLRSPYSGLKYAPDPELAGPWSYLGAASRLVYRLDREGLVGLSVVHTFAAFRYPDPFPVATAMHGLGLRLDVGR